MTAPGTGGAHASPVRARLRPGSGAGPGAGTGTIIPDARFSDDRLHRFELSRIWDETRGLAFFCGLNPSTAGKEEDDMTVAKGIGFAAIWGLGGTLHGNVHSLISTDPKRLRGSLDAVRPENDAALLAMAARARVVVLMWGAFKGFEESFARVAGLLAPFSPKCCGRTVGGFPRHISRIAYATPLEDWRS